jgi:hypothetical protein
MRPAAWAPDRARTGLEAQIGRVISTAVARLRKSPRCRLSYGVGQAKVGSNRIFDETGPIDRDLPVLIVHRHDDQSPIATLFSYAAHPVHVATSC